MTPSDPLACAARLAEEHLDGHGDRAVAPRLSGTAMRERFESALPDQGLDPAATVEELARLAGPGLLASDSGRFFGWVIGGALPAAIGAEWLATAWDQNAAIHATSPAAAVVEDVAGAWLEDLLGLPASASFAFVTGCQMAHVVGLAAARHRLLADRGWDVERRGLGGRAARAPARDAARHETLPRAARFLGFGTDALVPIAAAADGRLDPAALERELVASRRRRSSACRPAS